MKNNGTALAYKLPQLNDEDQNRLVKNIVAIEQIARRTAAKHSSRGAARAANLAQSTLAMLLPSVEECQKQIIEALTQAKPDLERARLLAKLVVAKSDETAASDEASE